MAAATATRNITVVGQPIQVHEWATVDEILRRAGVPNPDQRALVETKRTGEPGEVVPRQGPRHLKGGEDFIHLPVGTYGAAWAR